jgi:FkbM family methyltransferase
MAEMVPGLARWLLRRSPAFVRAAVRYQVARLHAARVVGSAAAHAVARRAARARAHEWGWFTLYLPSTEKPLFARPGTSDLQCFQAVFGRRQQDIDLDFEPRLIFDLGANVGYTAIDLALQYPNATIVAVEPEPTNAHILRLNTAAFPQVEVVEAGVWPRSAELAVEDVGNDRWGFQVREVGAGEGDVRAVTVPELIEQVGARSVDLLKLDIEGAEHELLNENTEWLERVRTVLIEFHEVRPGATATSEAVLARYGFDRRSENDENRVYARPAPASRTRDRRRPLVPLRSLRRSGRATNSRPARAPSRLPGSVAVSTVRVQRRNSPSVARLLTVFVLLVLVFVAGPEAIGDRPYDPRPSSWVSVLH